MSLRLSKADDSSKGKQIVCDDDPSTIDRKLVHRPIPGGADLEALDDYADLEALEYDSGSEGLYEGPEDYDGPEDLYDDKVSICRGPQTRLFWNLEDHPIPEGANLDLIYRKLKLALHRMGVHGYLHIWAYGGKLSHNECDFLYFPSPPPTGWSIAAQICVAILSNGVFWDDTSSDFVVIASQHPELNRVLQIIQSRFHQTVLTIEPHPGLLQSADSVFQRTRFVGGEKTRPQTYASERIEPVEVLEAGVFWDARDCPFPAGWTADSIYKRINELFPARYGFTDNMSVSAYLDPKKESSAKFLHSKKTWKSRIDFHPGEDTRIARHGRMLHDILLWSIYHPEPAQLIVAGIINKPMYHELGHFEELGWSILILRPTNDNAPKSYDWPEYLLDQTYTYGFK